MIHECQLVQQKDVSVADRDHVGVEGAGVDPARMLLRKEGTRVVDLAHARERFRGLARLARGKTQGLRDGSVRAVRGAAPGEQVDRGRAGGEKTDVIGGAFVGKMGASRKRIVDREAGFVGEDGPQDARGGVGFEHAVEHGSEVRRDEMQLAVGAVGGGNGRGGIRRPHRRGAGAEAQEVPVAGRRRREHLLVAPTEAELSQRPHPGALVRREDGLPDPERCDEAHLRQSLQRGALRVRRLPDVRERRDVSWRQARVVVRGTDDSVEVEFAHGALRLQKTTLRRRSGRPAPRRRRASIRLRSPSWRRAAPPRRSTTAWRR